MTDTHVEVLRDLLTGGQDAVSRAQEQERAGNLNEMAALVEAAFGVAARRAFAPAWTMPGVIGFVARVRIACSKAAENRFGGQPSAEDIIDFVSDARVRTVGPDTVPAEDGETEAYLRRGAAR